LWKNVKPFVDEIKDSIGSIFTSLFGGKEEDKIKVLAQTIAGLINAIVTGVRLGILPIKTFFQVIDLGIDIVKGLWETFKNFSMGLGSIFNGAWEVAKKFFDMVLSAGEFAFNPLNWFDKKKQADFSEKIKNLSQEMNETVEKSSKMAGSYFDKAGSSGGKALKDIVSLAEELTVGFVKENADLIAQGFVNQNDIYEKILGILTQVADNTKTTNDIIANGKDDGSGNPNTSGGGAGKSISDMLGSNESNTGGTLEENAPSNTAAFGQQFAQQIGGNILGLFSEMLSRISGSIQEMYEREMEQAKIGGNDSALKQLSKEAKESAKGIEIVKESIDNFAKGMSQGGPIMGLINMIIGWIMRIIQEAARWSRTLGKIFAVIGKIFEVIGKFIGVLSELLANISGVSTITDLIYTLLEIFMTIIEAFAGLVQIIMVPFRLLFDILIDGVNNLRRALGFSDDPGGIKALEKQQKELELEIKEKEKELKKLNEQIDLLESIKNTMKSLLEIQTELLQLELDREKRQWDIKTNKAMYQGLLENLKRMGAVRSDFDFAMYESLINPDGSINIDLGERLLKMLKYDQMDAGKIYDSGSKSLLTDLIGSLIGNQEAENEAVKTEADLKEQYYELQEDLNKQLKDLGYSSEELGYNFKTIANQLKKMSFEDFKNNFRDTIMSLAGPIATVGTSLANGLSPAINSLNNFKNSLNSLIANMNQQIDTKLTTVKIEAEKISSELEIKNIQKTLNDLAIQGRTRARDRFDGAGNTGLADWFRAYTEYGWMNRLEYIDRAWFDQLNKYEQKEYTDTLQKLMTLQMPKFHTGGSVKDKINSILKDDELFAVLQQGEYVVNKYAMKNPDIARAIDFINKNNMLPDLGSNITNNSTVNISAFANDYYDLFQQINKKISEYGKKIMVVDL